jgi:hypothetical protein
MKPRWFKTVIFVENNLQVLIRWKLEKPACQEMIEPWG